MEPPLCTQPQGALHDRSTLETTLRHSAGLEIVPHSTLLKEVAEAGYSAPYGTLRHASVRSSAAHRLTLLDKAS
jgi:hypothetical protein